MRWVRWMLPCVFFASACAPSPLPPSSPHLVVFGAVLPAPTPEELASAPSNWRAVWINRPSSAQIEAAYPQGARSAGIEARVELDCIVQADLHLACVAKDDGFREHDFESAALRAATLFSAAPVDPDGAPAVGNRVQTSIMFSRSGSTIVPARSQPN